MSRMINDIPSSDLSHNSRVFKLYSRMKDSQVRFAETIKGIEKYHYQDILGERVHRAEMIISQKYDDYMETLRKKEVPKEVVRVLNNRKFKKFDYPINYQQSKLITSNKMTILNKSVLCTGCRKKMTINFQPKDKTKTAKCSYCLKITEHQLKPIKT